MDGLFDPAAAEISSAAIPSTVPPAMGRNTSEDHPVAGVPPARDTARRPVLDMGPHVEIRLESANGPADAVGYFVQGRAGRPAFGQVIWARAGATPGAETVQIDLDGADPEDIGLFLIEAAAEKNANITDGMFVHFEHGRNGTMTVVGDGRRLAGTVAISERLDIATCIRPGDGQSIGFVGENLRHANLSARSASAWPMDGAVRPWI